MKTIAEYIEATQTNIKSVLTRLAVAVLFVFASANAPAQTYTVMHSFGTNVMGLYPYAPLVQGADGSLYGTALEGGKFNNLGQVFKVNPDGSGYTVLKDFNGAEGANPEAGLVLSGTTLYGTTREGGTNWYGTVFKLQTDGSGFEVLKEFAGDDGAEPQAGLALSGTTLYGTTALGGTNGHGIVFKLQTDGSGFAVLKHFSGSDGAFPHANLAHSGTTLFGTTQEGGSNYYFGTVFRLNTDGTDYRVLHSFTEPVYYSGEGTNSDGAGPQAGLALSGTTLFGTTPAGGANGHGVVFAVNTDGEGFAVLKDFTGFDGRTSCGDLLLSGATLYGTTAEGGSNWSGNVFKLNTDGSGFEVLKDLNVEDGFGPCAGLYLSNTTLIGTASQGGHHGFGTIFKLETDGSNFGVVLNFEGGDGYSPIGGLTASGATLYGSTGQGGSSGSGIVYKINADGTGYEVLASFTNFLDGVSPNGRLVMSDNTLYGTTGYGGVSNWGTVFRLKTDGSGLTVLKHFDGVIGSFPSGGLLLAGTNLYGMTTVGGEGHAGTLFKMATDGSQFVVLKHFDGTNGSEPKGGLLLVGDTLYGAAGMNGTGGIIFRINTDGSDYAVLKVFSSPEGEGSQGSLVLGGNELFGATQHGGIGHGTLFKLNLDGTGFAVLKTFNGKDGSQPEGGLALSGTTLFGTSSGGVTDLGTVFSIQTDGSDFSTLKYFDEMGTVYSSKSVMFLDGVLYGTADGGALGRGAVFRLSPGLPTIAVQPPSRTAVASGDVLLHVDATGWPPPVFQWFKDGVELNDGANIAGTQTATLALTNILGGDAGMYSVVVSNTYGSVTSSVATLTVVGDPFVINQPLSQTVNPGQTVQFNVTPDGTPPLSYQWLKNGVSLANGGNISGAHTATLTLTEVDVRDAAGYCVVVTNSYGSVTSRVAVLCGLNVDMPGYSVLHNFTGGTGGSGSFAGPVLGGDTLYGTTCYGGNTNLGTVFKVKLDGSGFAVLHSFEGLDGARPHASLVLSGSTLFGTTSEGGSQYDPARSNGNGTVFKVETDGSGYTVIKNFVGYSDGDRPEGALILSGATLYGTTIAGGNSIWNQGTVFKVNTDGSGFSVIHNFNGLDGFGPQCGLVLSGEALYGTTRADGIIETNGISLHGGGLIFKLNTNGSDYAVLKRFDGHDGREPLGSLLLSGNTLYGSTLSGGSFDFGTVFKIGIDGGGFTVLKHFTWGDGAQPEAGLLLSDSVLYGTTHNGGVGSAFWDGTVFKLNTDGSGFAVLKNFDGSAGANPVAGLVHSGTNLYGVTFYGGQFNSGVVFALPMPVFPEMSALPLTQTAEVGSECYFSALASGFPAPVYQWFLNGGALSGCTNRWLHLAGLGALQAGSYTVTASSIAGAVTSSPAILQVIPPVERRPVPALQLAGEPGSTINLECVDDLTPAPDWLPLASVSLNSAGQYHFDLSLPFSSKRFYRAWQSGMPVVPTRLELQIVPALTLTGNVGDNRRVDAINAIGPTDAWFTLATVTLTNTSQLYFDVSSPGQPQRLYRLVNVP
ncbi:MAG: hypothetical protein HOP33_19295 [Verrucomicrobia bacterium]|nr:hypothetical protein [Verrucomicrobiota bacterium]